VKQATVEVEVNSGAQHYPRHLQNFLLLPITGDQRQQVLP
jgi:hypothetical protein